jgi:cell division protein FtsB
MTRRRKNKSHLKELYYIILIVIAIMSAIFSFWGPGGFREMKKARVELETHRARIELLKRNNSERMQSINALKSDPQAQERYAREKGYGRKGEIVQQIVQEPEPADLEMSGAGR